MFTLHANVSRSFKRHHWMHIAQFALSDLNCINCCPNLGLLALRCSVPITEFALSDLQRSLCTKQCKLGNTNATSRVQQRELIQTMHSIPHTANHAIRNKSCAFIIVISNMKVLQCKFKQSDSTKAVEQCNLNNPNAATQQPCTSSNRYRIKQIPINRCSSRTSI